MSNRSLALPLASLMAPASCHASLGMLGVRRLSEAAQRRDGKKARPRAHTRLPVPDRRRLYADMAILLQQDLANIEAGFYPLPANHDGSLLTLLHRSRLFFEDLPEIHRRRESRAHNEVLAEGTRGKRPRYYLQNFHFQSGGWMTDDSASRYDTQVEVLFNGTANATRRQALPQLHEVFAETGPAQIETSRHWLRDRALPRFSQTRVAAASLFIEMADRWLTLAEHAAREDRLNGGSLFRDR
jgi:hypothetical protein